MNLLSMYDRVPYYQIGRTNFKYTNERTRNGWNVRIDYYTWHIGPHRSSSPLPGPSRPRWNSATNPAVVRYERVLFPQLLATRCDILVISSTENGYFVIRTLFKSSHIHPARLTNNWFNNALDAITWTCRVMIILEKLLILKFVVIIMLKTIQFNSINF